MCLFVPKGIPREGTESETGPVSTAVALTTVKGEQGFGSNKGSISDGAADQKSDQKAS